MDQRWIISPAWRFSKKDEVRIINHLDNCIKENTKTPILGNTSINLTFHGDSHDKSGNNIYRTTVTFVQPGSVSPAQSGHVCDWIHILHVRIFLLDETHNWKNAETSLLWSSHSKMGHLCYHFQGLGKTGERGCSGVSEEQIGWCGTLSPNQCMTIALFGLSIEVLLWLGPPSLHHGWGRG